MPQKEFVLENGLPVTVYKRRGGRNLRLSINASGKVRVTIPAWTPYKTGIDFAKARQEWIAEQHQAPTVLQNKQTIGKAHHLYFRPNPKLKRVTTRIKDGDILVCYPPPLDVGSSQVQKAASEAAVRALRAQAEKLLPQRLSLLAAQHGFTYGQVSVKRLKGRWGSCDQHGNLVFNLFLMQLPWQLIDYVILHELTHTRVLRHGPPFWQAMEQLMPDVKQVRKAIKQHQPVLK